MNEFKPVLLLARKSLIGLVLVLLLCAALVVGTRQATQVLLARLEQSKAALLEQQALIETKQADLAYLRAQIKPFTELRNLGLVGEPDRALWVEQLQESFRKTKLPEGLVAQLLAAKPLVASDAPSAIVPTTQTEPLLHDLQFEFPNAVETDVLGLVGDYKTRVQGRFRVNYCKFHDSKPSGLLAQCVLRFVSIPIPALPTPAPP